MILQKPPVYGSKESADMKNWFTRLYTILKEAIEPGTVQTASGSTLSFSFDVPAGTRRVTISFRGLSLSGSEKILVQLGDSGGIETTGYLSSSDRSGSISSSTAGFIVNVADLGGADIVSGHMTLILHDPSTNAWTSSHAAKEGVANVVHGGGDKALSGELTTVRIVASGSNTFDAGSVNIIHEQ